MAKLPNSIMAITTKYPICCVYSSWGIHNVTTKGQSTLDKFYRPYKICLSAAVCTVHIPSSTMTFKIYT